MAKKTTPGPTMAGCLPVPDAMGMNALIAPQLRMAEALIAQNIETLGFLRERFERDREMLARLQQTADPMAAMTLWGEFWQRMLTDYSLETTKLATSVTNIAQTAVRSTTEEAEAIAKAATGKG